MTTTMLGRAPEAERRPLAFRTPAIVGWLLFAASVMFPGPWGLVAIVPLLFSLLVMRATRQKTWLVLAVVSSAWLALNVLALSPDAWTVDIVDSPVTETNF